MNTSFERLALSMTGSTGLEGAGGDGLVGPILAVLLIVLLNVVAITFALRLRRRFREIGGPDPDE